MVLVVAQSFSLMDVGMAETTRQGTARVLVVARSMVSFSHRFGYG